MPQFFNLFTKYKNTNTVIFFYNVQCFIGGNPYNKKSK